MRKRVQLKKKTASVTKKKVTLNKIKAPLTKTKVSSFSLQLVVSKIILFAFLLGVLHIGLYVVKLFFMPLFEYAFHYNLIFAISLFAFFFIYHRDQLVNQRFQFSLTQFSGFFSLGLLFSFGYVLVRFLVGPMIALNHLYILLFLSSFFYFMTILFFFMAVFQTSFIAAYYESFCLFIVFVGLFYELGLILWSFRDQLVIYAAKISYYLLGMIYDSPRIRFEAAPILGVRDFSVAVGAPCSGVESLSLFTVFGLFVLVYDWQAINMRRFASLFFVGAAGMYAVNVLRVVFLVILGTYYPNLALTLFHSNAGWMFFLLYVFIYGRVFYPMVIR